MTTWHLLGLFCALPWWWKPRVTAGPCYDRAARNTPGDAPPWVCGSLSLGSPPGEGLLKCRILHIQWQYWRSRGSPHSFQHLTLIRSSILVNVMILKWITLSFKSALLWLPVKCRPLHMLLSNSGFPLYELPLSWACFSYRRSLSLIINLQEFLGALILYWS